MKTNNFNFNILIWQQHSYEHNIITCKFPTVLIIAIISLFAVLGGLGTFFDVRFFQMGTCFKM